MTRSAPEPVQVIKTRRDAALQTLIASIPYIRFLNVSFDRRGDELTAIMPYADHLIGNPALPALHGGATAAFLEITSIITLSWSMLWEEIEDGRFVPPMDRDDTPQQSSAQETSAKASHVTPRLPKTIDFTVDYLRTGLPRDAYARAHVTRFGRKYGSVRVEAWQDQYQRPFAQAVGHFLMPAREDSTEK